MSEATVTAQDKIPGSALWLGLLGAMPFLAAGLGCWFDPELARRGIWLTLGLTYGAVILSFLGGIRWGAGIGGRNHGTEFTLSVLPSIAAWVALLLPSVIGVSVLIGGFLMQALWDVTGVQVGRLPEWFGKLRMILTTIVIISLLAILGKLAL